MSGIIDFHCHVFPENIAEKATKNVGNYYNIQMHGNGTAEHLIKSAQGIDVCGFLVHSSATRVEQVQSVNNFVADCTKKYKQFIGFGTIHKDYENTEEEIKRIKAIGLSGLKLHPDFQNFVVDEPDMMNIYALAEHYKLPILVHAGDENTQNSTPAGIANVIDTFPKLKMVAAHMGGYSVWDEATRCLYGKNIYFDTSSTTVRISHERLRELIYLHGAHRVLFGSDYPVQTTKQAYDDIMRLNMPEKDVQCILYKNAVKLLGLSEI